jgi:hypothetical protein
MKPVKRPTAKKPPKRGSVLAKRKPKLKIVPIPANVHAPTMSTLLLKPEEPTQEPLFIPAIPRSAWQKFCDFFDLD